MHVLGISILLRKKGIHTKILGWARDNNYLCTYDLYGPMRNTFDAGSIHYLGKLEGVVGPWKLRVFWAL